MIDWNVVATIASPVIALFAGVGINRRFESRPALISYYGHVSGIRFAPTGSQPTVVNTHSVVLRNAGRLPATNVRLRHRYFPAFDIWPQVAHHVEELPNGAKEIVIPTLVPGEQVTISYLYFPPLTANQVNDGIRCDQGFAQPIPVLLQRQYPRWFYRAATGLLFIGLVTTLYLLIQCIGWLIRTYT